MAQTPPQQRNIGLDCLRAIAICVVLANHAYIGFFLATGKYQWQGIAAEISAQSIISIEWLFVLSGYLIGMMMIRSFSTDGGWFSHSRDFWLRRWFRTVPNYYFFVVVNAVLVYLGIAGGSFEWSFVYFSQNLVSADSSGGFFSESWSLALDEWFYFVMPIIIGIFMVFRSVPLKWAFFGAASLLIVLPMLGRFAHAAPGDFLEWDAKIRRVTIYHLDATGWGVLAAAVNRWYKTWWISGIGRKACCGLILSVAGLLPVWMLVRFGWEQNVFYQGLNALSLGLIGFGTFLLLPWLTGVRIQQAIVEKIVLLLSQYSYTIYLSHFPVLFLVRSFFSLDAQSGALLLAVAIVLWLGLVYLVSFLVYHYYEWPVSRIRDRLTKRVNSMPF